MAASLVDIARSLNVSISLVSKVLNGRLGTTGASADTIAAIRQKADELGYVKNSAAAGLATGRQNVIGVYIHHHGVPGSGIAESLVRGIAEAARIGQQRLILTYFGSIQEFDQAIAEITPSRMDGIIVGGVQHSELGTKLDRIRKSGLHVVTVMDYPIHQKIANVGIDQAEVGRIGTQHLVDQGCKNIAHIQVSPLRLKGYQQALEQNHLPYREEYVLPVRNYLHDTGVEVVQDLLARQIPFDGIAAQSDQQAIGALHALIKAGKKVPADVRIAGVDNSPFCSFCVVPMTSVSQEEFVRGGKAVEQLLAQMNGNAVVQISVDPVLHARASSA